MTTLSRLIAAATLISTTALAPALAAAADRRERDDRRDERGEVRREEGRTPGEEGGERGGWMAGDQRRDPGEWRDASRGRDRAADRDDRLAPPPFAPAWAVRDDLRWDGRGWVRAGWDRGERGERVEQARTLRWRMVQLERERAETWARLADRPWARSRAEATFRARFAELERELQRVTWQARR